MLSHSQETMDNLLDEELVGLSLRTTTEYVNELLCELEVGRFESHISAWRPVEDEAEVDMDQMPLLVNHDISVVTIFDLQNIADDTVSSETLDEV